MGADRARGQAAELGQGQNCLFDLVITNSAGLMGINIERQRLGDADGIGQLDRAARRQACGDHVLGKVAGDIGGRAINLGRILAAERAAAMRGRAAIGIHDDLATGQAGIAVRAADFKAAGGIDEIFGFAQQHWRDHFGHNPLHIGVELGFVVALVIARGVLG